METQIKAYYHTNGGLKLITLFGYATKGVPALEINGVGKYSRNIKEKLIYLTRNRQLSIPLRRFVICVDINELSASEIDSLKWLEFPLLLIYWYLAGLIPIGKLDNCIAGGWLKTNGEIYQLSQSEARFQNQLRGHEKKHYLLIGDQTAEIDASKLLEHIPSLKFKTDYIESSSVKPI